MRQVCWVLILAMATFAVATTQNAVGQNTSPQNPDKPKTDSDSQKEQFAAPPTKWDSRVNEVFFPDARAVLVGPRPAALTAAITGGAKPGDHSQQLAGGSASANSPGGKDTGPATWSKLISADALQDEIKSLAPQLADDVKTQQAFLGGAYKSSRQTLSLLAAAFAIVNEYDGDVRWKNQAAAARDVFARSSYNCKASTEQTYRDVKQRSEDLAALLRGETLQSSKGEATTDWGKVADLSPLMFRFQTAQRDRIAPWTADAGSFKKNVAAINHEAELLAAMAEVISRPGMENADDEKFRSYAKSLQKSALELQRAVNDDNYAAARTAAGALSKACANCHADYR
jgi:hypothetical protein